MHLSAKNYGNKTGKIMYNISDIISILSGQRFNLTQEKITQQEIMHLFIKKHVVFNRHFVLNKENIPDFFIDGIAIEVKIKGSKMAIYKQCQRYCQFSQVKILLLCSNKNMKLPAQINGKPTYYINLGKAWL